MYPNEIILGLGMYEICLCIAVAASFFLFGKLADKFKIKAKNQTFAVFCGVFAVALGYGSSVLFQAVYNIKERGEFVIDANTGATFYGGLIGGAAVFLAIYFLFGNYKYPDGSHRKYFFSIANCVAPALALSHAIGRVGCLFAGCCHGARTDAWYGIMMDVGNTGEYAKYVPTQLFETVFLLLLFGFLMLRLFMGGRRACNLSSYLIAYGIWRFFIENLRADYRGNIFTDALTPSQFIAILMIALGIGLIFVELYVNRRQDALFAAAAEHSQAAEQGEPMGEQECNDEE